VAEGTPDEIFCDFVAAIEGLEWVENGDNGDGQGQEWSLNSRRS